MTYWVPLALGLFAFLAPIFVGISWQRKLKRKNGGKVILESSSLSSPINMGITVSGVLVTLQISGISFLNFGLTGTSSTYYLAFASIASLTLAMLIGLWNSFSLATLTESNGQIPVSLSNNTYLPAQLVFQFSALSFGVILFFLFAIFEIPKAEQAEHFSEPNNLIIDICKH